MKKNVCMKLAIVCLLLAVFSGTVCTWAQETQKTLPNGKQVYQVLLIGSDRRENGYNGNSDVMILATINSAAEKLIITSFMRDLYADIPEMGVHKLNYAYAEGGAQKLKETLEDNYDLEIDHYAAVDFGSMADIIDLIGGVEITMSDAECDLMNGYLLSMNASEYSLPCGGTYILNGTQAVAYMRDRFVGNNDYQRTQRQRDVLMSMFDSLKNESLLTLGAAFASVMLHTEHDINPLELLELSTQLKDWLSWPLEESRIPYDDLYSIDGEMLVPDYPATISRLHASLYEGIE